MIRLYLLPVILTAGLAALLYCLSAIAAGMINGLGVVGGYGSLIWAGTIFAVVVFPFSAVGFLILILIIKLLRPRPWSISFKALVILCAGGSLGGALLAWLSMSMGALCGALSAGIWLGLNWRHLRSPLLTGTT